MTKEALQPSSQKQPVIVRNDASSVQRRASNPHVSSWVGASAGSGKTKVLTDRILRLLLPREDGCPGTPPQKILALTFTKAGANEMSLRLTKRLSEWAILPEDALRRDMNEKLLGRDASTEEIEAARKLFAEVVDTPNGLSIMTIHSFCQSVLGRFPIEAGLSPNFKALEESMAGEILDHAFHNVLSYAGTHTGHPLHTAIQNMARFLPEKEITSLIKNIIKERSQFETLLKKHFGVDGLYTALCAYLDIKAGMDADVLMQQFYEERKPDMFLSVADKLAGGGTKDIEKEKGIRNFWTSTQSDRQNAFLSYRAAFLTGKSDTKYPNKDIQKKFPELADFFTFEAERIRAFENTYKNVLYANSTRDSLLLGEAVLKEYEARKEKIGALDFDDLILKTLALLKGESEKIKDLPNPTQWVLYKLDEGLDHILVDEAQDTNPEQWEIIKLLSDEFFTGEGASDVVRTIFVVGDEKQSIFGFQRAAPQEIRRMRLYFEEKIRTSGQRFEPVDINTSFRSVQAILDTVDTVFSNPETARGFGDAYLHHVAHREKQAGIIENWPVLCSVKKDGEDEDKDDESLEETTMGGGWQIPDRIIETPSGSLQMAHKIAGTIAGWMESKEKLRAYDRPIRPGDIMVLVRSRSGGFVGQLVRALKEENISVSGVDRMILSTQIVAQDMVAAAAFGLLPDDDLTLACLLKSPFIGMEEETLFSIAYGRTSSLWEAVKEKADTKIILWLNRLIDRAGRLDPYAFFSQLVQEPCPACAQSGLRALHGRLGEDALDPLNEFLNAAMAYGFDHVPSIQGFIHWHETGENEIKRELDQGAGVVRIMTVHGAKGLQAPIVFLPDTIRTKSGTKEKIIWPQRSDLPLPFFVPPRVAAPSALALGLDKVIQKEEEEYRRLLYVAMTRAEERLYIGGYAGARGPSDKSESTYWYKDIRKAMETHKDIKKIPSGILDKEGRDIPVLRLETNAEADPDKKPKSQDDQTLSHPSTALLADWMFEKKPNEETPPRPLIPSRPSIAEPAVASPLSHSDQNRFKRGNITHKLMQYLPDLPVDRRKEVAKNYLSKKAFDLAPDVQINILNEVMAILDDPAFSALFGPGSLAEVPITGLLDDGRLISGQIDRLIVRQKDILILDYKTNRPPPLNVEDVPPVYVAQMKAYADALKKIYPERAVKSALLWTDGPRLMTIFG